MPNLVRIITLSLVLLLLFLAAALGAQSWLQQQHARLQTQAIAAKQRQLAAALELTRTQADLFSPDQLHLIGRMIDAEIVRVGDAAPVSTPAGYIGFIHTVPGTPSAQNFRVQFETPHLARLSLLHGRTWVFLLIMALALMLVFVSADLFLTRRLGH
uniref:hypothetical protein n=2 Tax=Cephaloticoccus sp. TaxID=1985742 RepID=UPI0040495639